MSAPIALALSPNGAGGRLARALRWRIAIPWQRRAPPGAVAWRPDRSRHVWILTAG